MRQLVRLLITILLCQSAYSAVRTWDGGGADTNWNTAANWVGDVAPAAGDDLVFPGSAAQFTTNNNFFYLTSFRSITFESGTYTHGGNPLRLTAGFTAPSGTHTVNFPITLSGAQTFSSGQGAVVTVIAASFGSTSPVTVDGDGTIAFGLINGSGSFTKTGAGISAIISASGYSGAVYLNNGILVVDANISGSPVTVNNPIVTGGGLAISGLGGTGTIGATNVVQGGISAGSITSPTGILNISGGLTLGADGAFLCKVGGPAPGANGHDQLNVTGSVALGSSRFLPVPWNNYRPLVGESLTVIRNDSSDPVSGTFLNAPEGAVFAGPLNTAFRISYRGGDGNDVVVTRVARALFDFDGDGRTDPATFRPSDGTWNRLLSSDGTVASQSWGLAGDRLAPADFDGDNRADLAVFRPSNGVWYILNSATGTVSITQFGQDGDIPVPNDFDGDGRADTAVFRPSNGVWYESRSAGNQFYAQQFGQSGDLPQMMDFDGDGIGDLAVYRPPDGTWHFWQSSTSSYTAFPFGLATDKPVPGDYDGDGRTDVAVFRAAADPSQPDFYILTSGTFNYSGLSWGVPGDLPVAGDYDGDGKADVGVFRPASKDWYLLRSTAGFGSVNFGQAGDLVVQAGN